MNNRIAILIGICLAGQEVKQTIFADIFFFVEWNDQARVEVTIIPDQVINVLLYKMKMTEYSIIRDKGDKGSIGFRGFALLIFFDEDPSFKFRFLHLSFSYAGHFEIHA